MTLSADLLCSITGLSKLLLMFVWPQNSDCIATHDGALYTPVPCNNSHGYACMMPAQCPVGFDVWHGACYHVGTFSQTMQSNPQYSQQFFSPVLEASKKCYAYGAALARPSNMTDFNYLGSYARNVRLSKYKIRSTIFTFLNHMLIII